MIKKDKFTLAFVLLKLFCDIVVIYSAFILSFYFRFYSGFLSVTRGYPTLMEYQPVFIFGTILIVLFFRNKGLYRGFWRGKLADELFEIVKGVVIGIFVMMAVSFMYREYSYSRGVAFIAMPLAVIGVSLGRLAVERVEIAMRKSKNIFTTLLIIGTGETAVKLAEGIMGNMAMGYEIKGFISDTPGDLSRGGINLRVLGKIDSLESLLGKGDIDEVILAERGFPQEKIIEIILTCEKYLAAFKFVPGIFEMIASRVNFLQINGLTLFDIHRFPLQSLWSRCVKRAFDMAGSFAGLVLFSPLFLITAVIVKLDSKGPVFFTQERCGEDGRVFKIIKFRTMIVGAEKETGPVWAKENDPRRTRVGGFLRKTNIDEIPQLINVLIGNMSLVGPRPERPFFVNQFKEDVPRYMSRHFIKSGVTGWAQVNGFRGDTSIEERIKYDLYYIENWSLFFDIKILFLTIFAMKNAY